MGQIEVTEYETVEQKVEKYECDNCGYIGEAGEFYKSERTPLTSGGKETFYYCETCDGAKAIAKREKELQSVADRLNRISEDTLVSGMFAAYALGSVAMSAYIIYLSDITGLGDIITAFLFHLIGWTIGAMLVLFLVFGIQVIGAKLRVVEEPF